MDLSYLKEQVMLQAESKGFGTKPSEVVVAEKIALIHSEISEAYSAYLTNNHHGKDGFHEELGDILQRTLHLGGIYSVNFKNPDNDLKEISISNIEGKIAQLHKLTSEAWEDYRHNKLERFKNRLVHLGYAILQVSQDYDVPIGESILKKIQDNKDRVWVKGNMNEKFTE